MYPKRIAAMLTDYILWLQEEKCFSRISNYSQHPVPPPACTMDVGVKTVETRILPLSCTSRKVRNKRSYTSRPHTSSSNCVSSTRTENLAFGCVIGTDITGYSTVILACKGGVEVEFHTSSNSALENLCVRYLPRQDWLLDKTS